MLFRTSDKGVVSHSIDTKDHYFHASISEKDIPPIDFDITGRVIHLGMVLLLIFLAASPLGAKRFSITLPACLMILFIYQIIMLYVGVRFPFCFMKSPLSPLALHYLEYIPAISRKLLYYINIFNRTMGWQAVPVLIWFFAGWKKWT